MKKRIMALVLALTMTLSLLTGCGSKSTLDENGIPTEAYADVVKYLTEGALDRDTTVLTVGSTDVNASYYLYWVAFYLNQMSAYAAYQGQTLDVSADFTDGKTMAQYFQELAEEAVVSYTAMEQKAAEQNIFLSEEDLNDQAQFREEQAAEAAALVYNCTTAEDQAHLFGQYRLGAALRDSLYGEGGTLAPSAATLQNYIVDNGYLNCRYILCKPETEDEAAYEEMKAKCQGYYDELSRLSGEALLKRFQEIQAESNADGNTEEFSFDSTSSLVDGFREVVAATNVGAIAMTDKTDYGYFVILRLDVDPASIVDEYISNDFSNQMTAWTDEMTVEHTEALNDLDIASFCLRLQSLDKSITEARQSLMEAEDAADAS